MDFVGLAAALAFIAVSPSAAAVTERSVDQFRQDAFSAAASPASSSLEADARNAGSFRLAQSTQGEDDGECNEYTGMNCSGDEGEFGAFHFDYLPSDPTVLEQWYDFQNEVAVDNIPNHWGPPYAHGLRTRVYGPGAPSAGCLTRGGAIMFSVKARALGCWRPAKAAPVRGLKVPPLGPAAQRVLTNCRFSTGSVILRKGAFACITTPRAVVRKAAKGSPVRPTRG
ncbi:MAG: hypothetical protein V4656_14625 [Pseudomonadota bacterium]